MNRIPSVPPRSPFATHLSGSARETELRIRNMFQWKKKRPPVWLMALTGTAILLCGSLVSCQEAPAGRQAQSSQASAASLSTPPPNITSDLNHNGIPEEIRLVKADGSLEIQISEAGQLLCQESPGIFLYTPEDGTDYLLRCSLNEYNGSFQYSYELTDFSNGFQECIQADMVRFDLNFSPLSHGSFDPDAIAAFTEEVNGLLAHSVLLSESEGTLLAQPASAVTLDWLDDFPDAFIRDRGKSLLENLTDFRDAMTRAVNPALPSGQADTLPLDQPLKLIFASGAGAWGTVLELNPDGSFIGEYSDTDGPIQYVCQFHGSFQDFVPLTASSWLLTLEELVLDTGYPVGTEWDAEGFHRISSQPYGLTDEEGTALRPGAQVILYTPEAQGHAPGTELYGTYDFLSWWPKRYIFRSAADTLGCYGLCNLATGDGFFS